MRLSTYALLGTLTLLGACSDREPTSQAQARVRNQPPVQCTQDQFARCPALAFEGCADGQEPVIDYGSNCCPIPSCQPVCDAQAACPMWPAPSCPARTKLVIATTSDCCPAYRCEPDNTACDPNGVPVACPLAMPYCGEGVMPVAMGQTDSCCPIYQCPPCVANRETGGPTADPAFCGCTYPTCAPDEQLECLGSGLCGEPCSCKKVEVGACVEDRDCAEGYRCELPFHWCDPAVDAPCPGTSMGRCVSTNELGCRADNECPAGQLCQVMCGDCQNMDCEARCFGACLPIEPVCQFGTNACAGPPPGCGTYFQRGIDPATCCPIYECGGVCEPTDAMCPLAGCYCGHQVGVDLNCCPIIECPDVTAPADCPPLPAPQPACGDNGACGLGESCMNNRCVAPVGL